LLDALRRQAESFEHVILANTSQTPAVALAERLAKLAPKLNKVSYASDGSCAVEMALKMSLHSRMLRGQQRTGVAALSGGYHGETLMALSVSDLGLYRAPYEAWCHACTFIENIPYVSGIDDPLWQDCSAHWNQIELQLAPQKDHLTAIIVEPLIQAAGGMRVYSADLLRRLRDWCDQHDVHLIADEIMTGYGRTARMLAIEHAGVVPDFLCLGKGLTGGSLPLSAMVTSTAVYDLFYGDRLQDAFLHSHTHTGNALACAVAVAAHDLTGQDRHLQHVQQLGERMRDNMQRIAQETGALHCVRQLGAMVAADIRQPQTARDGYRVMQAAIKRGALLRPLGNTIYWCPPCTMTLAECDVLAVITASGINDVFA
jgi:adenosylmethionine---8-amino-7-oxononanoate aminotransferase